MPKSLPRGFAWLIGAQFLSALADNALLIVAIAHLKFLHAPLWWAPLLKFSFTLSYVLLAPFIGALADAVCKRRLMGWMNGLKLLGALALLHGAHPMLAFALIGLGAAAYAPAKYGLLTESVPASALVTANGWLESAVVLSVLLGTVLGGLLISPWWLQADWVRHWGQSWPLHGAASAPGLNAAFLCVIGGYALSALCNLGVRASGARYPARAWSPTCLLADFARANAALWRDPSGGLSLGVTTVFWGLGAMLQFAVLHWAVGVLGLTLDRAAYLQGVVAVGVVAGALLAARRLRLRHASAVLPLTPVLGGVLLLSLCMTRWQEALPALLLVGALGGMLVVPMNALLQHRGHRLRSAGQSIAVQGFNENLGILLTLLGYAGLLALRVPAQAVLAGAGVGLIACVAWMQLRRRRRHGLRDTLRHLLGQR